MRMAYSYLGDTDYSNQAQPRPPQTTLTYTGCPMHREQQTPAPVVSTEPHSGKQHVCVVCTSHDQALRLAVRSLNDLGMNGR